MCCTIARETCHYQLTEPEDFISVFYLRLNSVATRLLELASTCDLFRERRGFRENECLDFIGLLISP